MREYKTQMEAARKGIVTEELKKVAQKEHMRVEELIPLVAAGKVAICANKNHKCLAFPLLQLSDRVYARSRSADALGQTRTQRRSGRSAENLERNSPHQPANPRIREFPNRL